MKIKPLSISGYSLFMQCPYKFYLHYKERIRPTHKSSALIFGLSLDKYINDIFQGKTPNEVDEMIKEEIKLDTVVQYFKADLQLGLVDSDFLNELEKKARSKGYSGNDFTGMIKRNFMNDNMSASQREIVNELMLHILSMKLRIIARDYEEQIIPKFSEVYDVQKQLEFKDKAGNPITGVLDFKAKYRGKKYLMDNKTSSVFYEMDSVSKSVQLNLYGLIEDMDNLGFVVMNKVLRPNKIKTCMKCGSTEAKTHLTCPAGGKNRCGGKLEVEQDPDTTLQTITGKRNEALSENIIKSMTDVNKAIRNDCYPKNLNACQNMFGRPCPYINFCWKKSKKGLKKIKE